MGEKTDVELLLDIQKTLGNVEATQKELDDIMRLCAMLKAE